MANPDPKIAADSSPNTPHWNSQAGNETSGPSGHSIRYEKQAALGDAPCPHVWRAYDHDLRRVVAIKILPEERISDSSGFLSGVRNIASIRHPGIVQIHDIVEGKDGLSIISDYVEGGSLAERLKLGPCPHGDVLEWGAKIAETLAFIHSKGIIHGDVTPGNILISENGQALLSNFCRTRIVGDKPAAPTPPEKMPYMAPEFFLGCSLEPRFDVFSLGVLLMEGFTGRKLQKNLGPDKSAPTPPNQFRKTPAALHALLGKCVSASPVERPSARELANTLRKIQAAGRQRRPWMGAIVAVGMAICALGSWYWLAPDHWLGIHSEAQALSRVDELSRQLRLLNPDFDGTVNPLIENGLVMGLEMATDHVSDLAPLASFQELNYLKASSIDGGGEVRDLAPIRGLGIKRLQIEGNPHLESIVHLKGMPLEYLSLEGTGVSDLSALSGAPLKTLNCSKTLVKSLKPLANAPLATLWINDTKVDSLDGLQGMRLTSMRASRSELRDLTPLSGMPLQIVDCNNSQVESIEPLRGMKDLSVLSVAKTKVTNLSTLLTLPRLKFLYCDIDWKRDELVLRQLEQLELINDSKRSDLIRRFAGEQTNP